MSSVCRVKLYKSTTSKPVCDIWYDDRTNWTMIILRLDDVHKLLPMISAAKSLSDQSGIGITLTDVVNNFQSLQILEMSDVTDSNTSVADLVSAIPSLTSIKLTNCTVRLGNLKSDRLENLKLECCTVLDDSTSNLNGLTTLKKLRLVRINNGRMPILNGCTALQVIYISELSNDAADTLDDQDWSDMTSLQSLVLGTVNLSATKNRLDWLGQLTSLSNLHIKSCHLSIPFPSTITALTSLRELDLSDNGLTGTIPQDIGQLTNLKHELNLSNNRLTGTIPDSIGALTNLSWLDLSNNRLSGPIPSTVGNMNSLYDLKLSNNELVGPIPDSISNLTELNNLYLHSNRISSDVSMLLNLPSLSRLYLQDNPIEQFAVSDEGSKNGLSLCIEADRIILSGTRWNDVSWSDTYFRRNEIHS